MVIKILQGSKSFAGVSYNHEKIEEGKAELLGMYNMQFPTNTFKTSEQIKSYFKVYSSANKKVKKPQFHATISAKGKSKSKEELKAYSEKYMEHMGYDKQPYLVYFHRDTNNNHVHIVSTRINQEGRYINDSFEKLRSNEFRDRTLNINYETAIEQLVDQTTSYSYSSDTQAALYIESLGYKTFTKDDTIHIIKSGKKRGVVPKQTLNIKAVDKKETSKLYELFKKYSDGLEVKPFRDIIHKNFGIELVFHYGKNKEIPYGYTVFDHQNLKAYKGSEIIPINAILKGKDRVEKKNSIHLLLRSYIKSSISFTNLKEELRLNDFSLSTNGSVYLKDTNEKVFKLSSEDLQQLRHFDNKEKFNSATIRNINSLDALKSLYNQNPQTLWKGKVDATIDIATYREKILSFADYGPKHIKQLFKDENWRVYNFKGKAFILDVKNNTLLDKEHDLKLDLTLDSSLKVNQLPDTSQSQNVAPNLKIPTLFDFEIIEEPESFSQKPKKPRRRNNRNQNNNQNFNR